MGVGWFGVSVKRPMAVAGGRLDAGGARARPLNVAVGYRGLGVSYTVYCFAPGLSLVCGQGPSALLCLHLCCERERAVVGLWFSESLGTFLSASR